MTAPSPALRAAVRRLTFSIFWKFLLISVAYGLVTFYLRSVATIAIVTAGTDRAMIPIVLNGISVAFAVVYYLLAYFVLHWLIGDHVGDQFVLRGGDAGQPVIGEGRTHV